MSDSNIPEELEYEYGRCAYCGKLMNYETDDIWDSLSGVGECCSHECINAQLKKLLIGDTKASNDDD